MPDNDTFTIKDGLRLLATIIWIVIFIFWPRITLGSTFIIIGMTAIAFNAMIFWQTVFLKDHASSVVPFFGGIFAAAGIVILPITETWKWVWVPLVIDWGGLPMILAWLAGYNRD